MYAKVKVIRYFIGFLRMFSFRLRLFTVNSSRSANFAARQRNSGFRSTVLVKFAAPVCSTRKK